MKTKNVAFSGINPNETLKWEDIFEQEYNDAGQLILVSKEKFSHEDDDFRFDYHYAINAVDMYFFTADASVPFIKIDLLIVPDARYWNDELIADVAKELGMENASKEDIISSINVSDAISHIATVTTGKDTVKYDVEKYEDGFYDILDNEDVVNKLNAVASVIPVVDSFRGFSLDREWNGIGTTGWDTIKWVLNGGDLF